MAYQPVVPEASQYSRPELPDVPGLQQVFVAGRWVPSMDGSVSPVVCPADETIVAEVVMPSIADADLAVAGAREAFDNGPWPRMSIAERTRYCTRLADAIESRLHRLNIAWMLEAGAPLSHSEMINSGAGKMVWRNALDIAPKLKFEELREGR
jgi:aldehyde dehydrogenase (NAD+)